ncbi:protein of unknown function (plasmid) [Caballeronia sp. S22]
MTEFRFHMSSRIVRGSYACDIPPSLKIDDGNRLPGNHLRRQEICATLATARRRFVCIFINVLHDAATLKHTVFETSAKFVL